MVTDHDEREMRADARQERSDARSDMRQEKSDDYAAARYRLVPRWLIPFIICGCFVIGSLAIGSVILAGRQAKNANKIILVQQRQEKELQNQRGNDYRLCLREQVSRARGNLFVIHNHHGLLLTLYDCTPDLTGTPAIPLTINQTAAFERRVVSPTSDLP